MTTTTLTPAESVLTAREQTIHGLRQLADLLENRTDLPVPYDVKPTGHLRGGDEIARLFDLAESLGVEVQRYEIQGHYVYHALLPLAGSVAYELYARGEDVPSAPRDHMVVAREDVLGPTTAVILAAARSLETAGTGMDGAPC